ncbi:ribosome-binding protein 1 isoform X2 [Frankliniella occidentalis]|uniref:Ribosome-binding protein 1 isoform X2 n=1 Tax=Frankliniella occidentalis TaxID=133901 RepID=A0A6J1TAV0_FRAOC|nr:ribosome-binding protein 1 isoform X2 [Frankliniella occidentalis]
MEFLLIFGVAMLVTVFIGTAVYFIMTYGTKEKTYEEAILEQRQRSEDAFFLGKSAKEKQKEKKLKKAGKKVKEKSEKAAAMRETTDSVSSDEIDQNSHSHHKNQHVAFVAEPAIIDEPLPSATQEKKKKKVTKAKPILINKDDAQLVLQVSPPLDVNHFETIHPKDDLEMRRQSRDESAEQTGKKATLKLIEVEKSKAAKKDVAPKVEKTQAAKPEKQVAAKAEKANNVLKAEKAEPKAAAKESLEKQEKAAPVPKEEKKTPVQETVVAVAASVVSASAPAPSKSKKKKGELTLEQMTAGRDGINANLLEPLIHKAELSRSEIQNLIDLLLNKQQGSETEVAEWNEGRQDPMMKLKKAYAEKEKALQEEQSASLALQNKLREVRAESNSERSRLTAVNKQLEEKLLNRTNEIAAATAKFHHEKHTLAQQLQQLKHQLDQEHQLIRKYQDELGQAQNAMQTQQTLEHHIANLNLQLSGQNNQIGILQQQVGENQTAVQQCELLSAQVAQLQEQLKNAQNSNQGEVHSKQKQLNEIKAAKEEVERQLSAARQREGQLSSELAKLKDLSAQRQSEIEKLSAEAAEVSKLREENESLTSQFSLVSQLQKEARQLREENESLAAQVTAVTERPAAEGRENGDVVEEKHADGKLASAQLINDLREKDLQVEELLEQVKQAEKSASSTIDSLKSEINAHKNEVALLTTELDQQRKKNDELRNKNYKAMDALTASEKMFQSKIQETEKVVHEAEKAIQVAEEKKMQAALQRLFPSITVEEKVHDQWVKKFSAAVSKHITELSSKQSSKQLPDDDQSAVIAELEKRNSQLSGMVTNYKRIIEDTEGMLNKLQLHVEAEETKWQQQLADKEAELATVIRERDDLRNHSSGDKVDTQLGELQNKLQSVEAERNSLKSQLSTSKDTLSTIDQLKEERNRLSADLAAEQAKALDQSNQLAKLKSLLEETENAISQEKASSQQLKEEIEKLKESHPAIPASPVPSVHNGATNGPSVEPASAEKAASSKKKLSGWFKKKTVGSKSPQHSPNLSARGDDFLTNERMESS